MSTLKEEMEKEFPFVKQCKGILTLKEELTKKQQDNLENFRKEWLITLKNKENVFLLQGSLPTSPIEKWQVNELCYLYEHQRLNTGDKAYLEKIKHLIISKVDRYGVKENTFIGNGCCSEYRNSVRFQVERLKEIIKLESNE